MPRYRLDSLPCPVVEIGQGDDYGVILRSHHLRDSVCASVMGACPGIQGIYVWCLHGLGLKAVPTYVCSCVVVELSIAPHTRASNGFSSI